MQIGDAKRERRMTSRHMSVEEKTGFKKYVFTNIPFQQHNYQIESQLYSSNLLL